MKGIFSKTKNSHVTRSPYISAHYLDSQRLEKCYGQGNREGKRIGWKTKERKGGQEEMDASRRAHWNFLGSRVQHPPCNSSGNMQTQLCLAAIVADK